MKTADELYRSALDAGKKIKSMESDLPQFIPIEGVSGGVFNSAENAHRPRINDDLLHGIHKESNVG